MTKLVSGVASRKPPFEGWISERTRSVGSAGDVSQPARERIQRRSVMMDYLPERNQRREGIADDRQAHRAEPLTRQRAELKRQGPNLAPRFGAPSESSRQRARHQDRDRKCSVVAVTSRDRSSDGPPIDTARRAPEIIFRAVHRLRISSRFHPPRRTPPSKARSCSDCSCSGPCHPSRRQG